MIYFKLILDFVLKVHSIIQFLRKSLFTIFLSKEHKIAFNKDLEKFYKDSEAFLGKKDEAFNKHMWARFIGVMLYFYTYFLTWFYPYNTFFHYLYFLSLIILFINIITTYFRKKAYLKTYTFENDSVKWYLIKFIMCDFRFMLLFLMPLLCLMVIEGDYFWELYTYKNYLPKIKKFFWLDGPIRGN